MLDKIPSKDILVKRRVQDNEQDLFCVLCNNEIETNMTSFFQLQVRLSVVTADI